MKPIKRINARYPRILAKREPRPIYWTDVAAAFLVGAAIAVVIFGMTR